MSAAIENNEQFVLLEDGYRKVQDEGIVPFVRFVETGEQTSFNAKEFVNLYDLIFKMCIQRDPYNWSDEMYDRYSQSISSYLANEAVPKLEASENQFGTTFLRVWKQRYHNHNLVVRGLSKVFMYLDRFHTPNNEDVLPLKEQGWCLFREAVYDKYYETARANIQSAVNKEREGEEQDTHLLSEAVAVFVNMEISDRDDPLAAYRVNLEQPLVADAELYYQRQAHSWLDGDSCPNYMEKAEQCLTAERRRVETYLNASSMQPLVDATHRKLLVDHLAELLTKSTGLDHMLETNRSDDLARLYRLYRNYTEPLKSVAIIMEDHIKAAGKAVVDRESKADQRAPDGNHSLVRSLIGLHDRYAKIVSACFENSTIFVRALKNSFEAFINMDNRVSKLLAKFVNDVLRKHSKVKLQNGLDSTLDNVVFLYGYITEKDVFERDYQHYLAARLLMGMCESEHSEKSMIAKLKTECGYQWTNRLEGMFKDVQLSKENMLRFRDFFNTEQEMGLTLDVNVCTTGYWPSSKHLNCRVPRELERATDKFQRFYLNSHSGHKLKWRMDQGQAEVQVAFAPKVRRTLVCTTHQMSILLAFNAKPGKPLSFKELLELTTIPRYEIANHLLSLIHPNIKVVIKKPNVKALEDTDLMMINPKFTSKTMRLQIPLLSATIDTKKQDEDEKAILLQRQHQVDAAIVRICKTRKTIRHNQLVAEVISQLQARFKPKPPLIKKRIEVLIESEYLRRSESDRSTYEYMA